MADPLEEHAREFTDIERQTLRVWFDVDQAGNDMLADAVLNAGLQFEHYTSLLANDPAQRTMAQLQKQAQLAFQLSEQLSLAEAFLKAHVLTAPTPPRMGAQMIDFAARYKAISEGRSVPE